MNKPDNPYQQLVQSYAKLLKYKPEPLAQSSTTHSVQPASGAEKVLIFAPHPDDECIIGALPLRLLRQQQLKVINIAVTLGSQKSRQSERQQELVQACAYLDFALDVVGLERITPIIRQQDKVHWQAAVNTLANTLVTYQPLFIFMPHARDWNGTHIGVHYLVMDTLAKLPDFTCQVVETEFWGAMDEPNLMVESTPEDVASLVAALALHRGEVARNPYHLRLPAWMIDNVRRGAELVGGQGGQAPSFAFATLYRLSQWSAGQLHTLKPDQPLLAADADLTSLWP